HGITAGEAVPGTTVGAVVLGTMAGEAALGTIGMAHGTVSMVLGMVTGLVGNKIQFENRKPGKSGLSISFLNCEEM
ncbi:MAG TPA: hypothetical protein DEO88_18055, partial [Syntrophobacteraceae bacterium]|nr:hypothetical protein [Syntrophobacteraceae bacterium]